MNLRPFIITGLSILVFLLLSFSSCRRINDYTEVGDDLIPPIDNITTFDTSLTVQAFNDTFSLLMDSLRVIANDEHFLGLIQNDPIFGKTHAEIYLELKPDFFGSYPFSRRDSLIVDSLVLVLGFTQLYGDSLTPQTINVYELNQELKLDSFYLLRVPAATHFPSPLNLPGQLIYPNRLDDSVKVFQDTTAGQLRIKLDTNLARRFLNYDTSNAYKSDSAFKRAFKGFAIKSEGSGNALMGFKLRDNRNTKLAFYYRIPSRSGNIDSTVVRYFTCNPDCKTANYIKRNYTGTPVASAAGQPSPAQFVYLQNTPGTYAIIKIPDLATLTNRLVHRAELIMEQIYHPSDTIFPPPSALFLDAYDSTITGFYKYRTVPFANDYDLRTGYDFFGFGINPFNGKDPGGNNIKIWRFNLTRYVQNIINGNIRPHTLRLYAPFLIRGKSKISNTREEIDIPPGAYINKTYATGRVRLGGGNHPTQKMRLRIVYSKQ
ncbi:MAG: DUF4270 domain-containing protein [Chitinophagaceae bacterium]|nr:DUF4270 domain-containing protein [Chitinophagaceae bacterium]